MRKIIYTGGLVLFLLLCFWKINVINEKRAAEVPTIEGVWKKQGRPVDVVKVVRGDLNQSLMLSGLVRGNRILVQVGESQIKKLEIGQSFEAEFNNRYLSGKVSSLTRRANAMTGMYAVTLQFDSGLKVKQGSHLRVNVVVRKLKNCLLVSNNCILDSGFKKQVYAVTEKGLEKRPIKILAANNQWSSVNGNINEHEQLVFLYGDDLTEGQKVYIHAVKGQ